MGLFGSIVDVVFGKEISKFEVMVTTGMHQFKDGANINCVNFQFKGKIGNSRKSPSTIVFLLTDSNEKTPMLSLIDDCRLNGDLDPRFMITAPLPPASDYEGYKNWINSGLYVPLELIRHPYKGSRTMMCGSFVVDNLSNLSLADSWITYHFATGNTDIIFDDFGYMDAHKNRDRVKELSIDLCMVMAASDGSLDQSELNIIKGWTYRDCQLIDDATEKAREKEKFSKYLKKSYSKAKKGEISHDHLVNEINKICDNSSKHNLIELLLEVISADGVFSSDEDKLLNKLVKSLDIDNETFNAMKNKTVLNVESIETDNVSLEGLLGITNEMSKNEKCDHLRKQYTKWLNQTTNRDPKIKDRAQQMIANISTLRSKFGCD